jgi:hypothetical protein
MEGGAATAGRSRTGLGRPGPAGDRDQRGLAQWSVVGLDWRLRVVGDGRGPAFPGHS